jgi:hypothetical protein
MSPKAEPNKNPLTYAERLIHEVQNCVHKINMELDLEERGLKKEKVKYADLMCAVDSMSRSLEDLRVHLVRIEERAVVLKRRGQF